MNPFSLHMNACGKMYMHTAHTFRPSMAFTKCAYHCLAQLNKAAWRLLLLITVGKKVLCNDALIVYYNTYVNTDTSLFHEKEKII